MKSIEVVRSGIARVIGMLDSRYTCVPTKETTKSNDIGNGIRGISFTKCAYYHAHDITELKNLIVDANFLRSDTRRSLAYV